MSFCLHIMFYVDASAVFKWLGITHERAAVFLESWLLLEHKVEPWIEVTLPNFNRCANLIWCRRTELQALMSWETILLDHCNAFIQQCQQQCNGTHAYQLLAPRSMHLFCRLCTTCWLVPWFHLQWMLWPINPFMAYYLNSISSN